MINLSNIKSFNEHEKLFKVKTGEDFTFFYEKYYPKLIYYTRKMCNDQQKAEDITTESFLTAFEKVDKYDKEIATFSTWLFTIARNIMFQEIKTDRKSISMDVEYDNEGTTLKDFMHDESGTDDSIKELNIRKAEIMKIYMEELKEPYKTVINMREIQKMPYKDISEKLGKNLSTIKSQIRNARIILKEQTKREFQILDDMFL